MNKIKYTTALFLGGLLSFSSCTDNFADFNSTDGAYTEELQKYDNQTNLVPFATIQKGIIYQTGVDGTDWQYQVYTELSGGHVLRILPRHERFVQCQQLHL